MNNLTINDEIKDIEERIQNSITEAYEKAFVIERGNQKFNGIFRLSLGTIAFITLGVILFNLPVGGISELFANGEFGVLVAPFVLGSGFTGAGIYNLINARKLDNQDLNLYDRYLFVRRLAEGGRCDYVVKEMYDRIEKLFGIRKYLVEKRENGMVSTNQVSTPIEPMRQPEEPIKEIKGGKARKR